MGQKGGEKMSKITIDTEKIVNNFLQDNYEELKEEIKEEIKRKIANEVLKALDLDEFREKNYTERYLTQVARDILAKEIKDIIKEYIKNWIEDNLNNLLEGYIYSFITDRLSPLFTQALANSIIIDEERLLEVFNKTLRRA